MPPSDLVHRGAGVSHVGTALARLGHKCTCNARRVRCRHTVNAIRIVGRTTSHSSITRESRSHDDDLDLYFLVLSSRTLVPSGHGLNFDTASSRWPGTSPPRAIPTSCHGPATGATGSAVRCHPVRPKPARPPLLPLAAGPHPHQVVTIQRSLD